MDHLFVQFSDCGQHIRKWSREPFAGSAAFVASDALIATARNLERYPFISATMMEAGQLAASAIRAALSSPSPTAPLSDGQRAPVEAPDAQESAT